MRKEKKNILIVLDKLEGFERAIIDATINEDYTPFVLDIREMCITEVGANNTIQLFFATAQEQVAFLCEMEFDALFDELGLFAVLSIGIEASKFCLENNLDRLKHGVIFPHGELNFSNRRFPGRLADVQAIARNHKRIFFDSQYSFISALDKQLECQNFLIEVNPVALEKSSPVLSDTAQSIAIIVGPETTEFQISGRISELRTAFPDHSIQVMREETLAGNLSLKAEATLQTHLRQSLSEFSHLVFESLSRNTVAFLRSMPNDFDRIQVVENIHLNLHAWDIDKNIGLSPAHKLVSDMVEKSKRSFSPASDNTSCPSIVAQIENAANGNFPEFYEDLLCLRNAKKIDVFFSVTTIEAGSEGARAQRLRNMFLAFRKLGRHVVDVSSVPHILERRLKLIKYLAAQGMQFEFLYGENSTSPIASIKTVIQLEDLLNTVKTAGGQVGWFIRDLHFMYDVAWSADGGDELKDRAAFEFLHVSKETDVFYTPTELTNREFREVLPKQARSQTVWKELSPGVRELGLPPVLKGSRVKLAMLYTGGLGTIYKMDGYFETILRLSDEEDLRFDFVVRPAELVVLEEHGITEETCNVRIFSGNFDYYQSQAQFVIGTALLENKYANEGFPVKISNYISRKMPILHFEDAYYAPFLDRYRIGRSVKSNSDSINTEISSLLKQARSGNWPFENAQFDLAVKENSWMARCESVLEDLVT